MNPGYELKALPRNRELVSPPRRFFSRYALPALLLLSFAAVVAYAARDALVPVTEVQVVQPVIPAGGLTVASAPADEPAEEDTVDEPDEAVVADAGEPIFQAPGWIEPDPFVTLVSSLIPGTLSEVYVREGEVVNAGKVVAELDSTDARIALQKAEANVAVRKAELSAAQENWEYPIALDKELRTARAELDRLKAEKVKEENQSRFQLKLAEISNRLGRAGADSALTAEQAVVEARVAQATVREIEAQIEAQQALLDAATSNTELRIQDRSRLDLATAQMRVAEAELEESRVNLERCEVQAPTTGTVMRLMKTPGGMVSMDVPEGTQIISMYNPEQLQVRAEVPLADAGKIRIGLPAKIQVEALPGKSFRGELTRVVHMADVQRNSLQVKVRIIDPEAVLKPEMVARVEFMAMPVKTTAETQSDKDRSATTPAKRKSAAGTSGLLIPGELVDGSRGATAQLWMVNAESRAYTKQITLGSARGEMREVSSGLQPSDKIIVSDTAGLKEGARVKIVTVKVASND